MISEILVVLVRRLVAEVVAPGDDGAGSGSSGSMTMILSWMMAWPAVRSSGLRLPVGTVHRRGADHRDAAVVSLRPPDRRARAALPLVAVRLRVRRGLARGARGEGASGSLTAPCTRRSGPLGGEVGGMADDVLLAEDAGQEDEEEDRLLGVLHQRIDAAEIDRRRRIGSPSLLGCVLALVLGEKRTSIDVLPPAQRDRRGRVTLAARIAGLLDAAVLGEADGGLPCRR